MDQIYNVGSYDEISNMALCSKLLTYLDIPHETQEELHKWVKHTIDRPFNDHRYAIDGTKLRKLGWSQKTSFSDGMAITVDWYKQFGERWWGDITKVLTPFPTVTGTEVIGSGELFEDTKENSIVALVDSKTHKRRRTDYENGIGV